jgi:hypothetical protein
VKERKKWFQVSLLNIDRFTIIINVKWKIKLKVMKLILIRVYNSKKVINIALKNEIGQLC